MYAPSFLSFLFHCFSSFFPFFHYSIIGVFPILLPFFHYFLVCLVSSNVSSVSLYFSSPPLFTPSFYHSLSLCLCSSLFLHTFPWYNFSLLSFHYSHTSHLQIFFNLISSYFPFLTILNFISIFLLHSWPFPYINLPQVFIVLPLIRSIFSSTFFFFPFFLHRRSWLSPFSYPSSRHFRFLPALSCLPTDAALLHPRSYNFSRLYSLPLVQPREQIQSIGRLREGPGNGLVPLHSLLTPKLFIMYSRLAYK